MQVPFLHSTVQPFHLHPMAVHFPLALLSLGLLPAAVAAFGGARRAAADRAAAWLLWVGTGSLWLAVGLGLLAERTAPHVPPAWEVLAEHEELGLWTAGLFTGIAILRAALRGRFRVLFLVAWIAAAAVMLSTAYHGGQLVYRFGMGVVRPE